MVVGIILVVVDGDGWWHGKPLQIITVGCFAIND